MWDKAGLQTADSLIVTVTTDTDVVGWGETFGLTAVPAVKVAIDSILAPECIGRDATQIGKLMLDLQKKFRKCGQDVTYSKMELAFRPCQCDRLADRLTPSISLLVSPNSGH